MSLFSILIKTSARRVLLSLLTGLLAGILYTLLIPLVTNSYVNNEGFEVLNPQVNTFFGMTVSNYKLAALFLFSCLCIYLSRTISQTMLIWVVIDATSNLRRTYFERIIRSPLAKLEQVGSARLIASITTDVRSILDGAQRIPDILISSVSILGMMLFILYLNTDVFYFIFGAVAFGIVSFFLPVILGNKFFRKARESVDHLHEAIKGNIYGIKELKLCAEKRKNYLENVLFKVEGEVRSANKKGSGILSVAVNYGEMISFFVIGYITYIFINYHAISVEEIMAVVMVLLYLTGPISIIMQAVPELMVANVSLRKLENLFSELSEEKLDETVKTIADWDRLTFSNINYSYESKIEKFSEKMGAAAIVQDNEIFTVGPLNFEMKRGEVTFIVGGNGSGKSTLAKLLTGHYISQEGGIHLGDTKIDSDTLISYRHQVSAIFTDYYLFDQLLGNVSDPEQVADYMRLLKIDEKVSIVNGKFSTLSLSDGQRKRLALLISFLEDKDIYLFDEWAADQDPIFKDVFYQTILQSLRDKNKLIIVISHDDRYFYVADQILTMERGKLIDVWKKPATLLNESLVEELT
ncbi:MAG: cyclic peptide export ABC transporter [Gammaproteobacteria bacterium]|nr:cyclic peptide export ABC transporter [Gammaproteobacteria bacterium]MBU2056891.1 cyclic peptide export ABC transporter [Gammaproteobacteria bacterium]MBU2174577.1 cyclic peptide export ABC transporter [Gammaproteobacteria bacterium]MBU2248269.1 cyclic peptide export ABC transporter [Gammaproteobacteria bacterium]MBU2343726.1 cyclic peptide export ABC transporter [Gammaproteobacteria bacterium]